MQLVKVGINSKKIIFNNHTKCTHIETIVIRVLTLVTVSLLLNNYSVLESVNH